MKSFIDVDGRRVATNSAAVLSTLMTGNNVKKISTIGPFQSGAVESEAARQDVEVALNEGMKTHVSIDDMQLFVREVIDKNLEEEYMEEVNESADRCHEPETHDEFALDDVNNCKLDPARVREGVHERKAVTGHMPNKVSWIDTNKHDEVNPKYRSRLVAEDFKR